MTTVETRPCLFCGKVSFIELPFPAVKALAEGRLLQDVLPNMAPADREVILSGVHPACWPG